MMRTEHRHTKRKSQWAAYSKRIGSNRLSYKYLCYIVLQLLLQLLLLLLLLLIALWRAVGGEQGAALQSHATVVLYPAVLSQKHNTKQHSLPTQPQQQCHRRATVVPCQKTRDKLDITDSHQHQQRYSYTSRVCLLYVRWYYSNTKMYRPQGTSNR